MASTARRYLLIADLLFLVLASLPHDTCPLSFNFPSFNQNNPIVTLQGDASVSSSQIQLTKNQLDGSVNASYGRALYPAAVQLWVDGGARRTTNFTTHFTFSIAKATTQRYGDGLTFLLVPNNTQIPVDSYGRCLALFSNQANSTRCVMNQTLVAVEFDTFKNGFDPSADHIGIDVNSIQSAAYVNVSGGLKNTIAQALISYDSTSKNLSVSLNVVGQSSVSLSYIIDLSTVLPEIVQVGFSASTGTSVELHKILDWSFSSTLEGTLSPSPVEASTQQKRSANKGRTRRGLAVGVAAAAAAGLFLILMIGVVVVWIRSRREGRRREANIEATRFDIDEDFDEEAGPKRFAYSELSRATNNFAMEGKLGEGGFGGVYKGVLAGREIAVKKIKSGSSQGKKEYISEVKIISRLRHRNLVQLLGWCHDNGELLLVYEFMPNRSLDSHLFNPRLDFLPWATRYKISLGLASALLYLHEEWEQSVVHRDIKCSNVMLDLNFNPKLGDFGLARLADHDVGLQTTAVAGTMGYLAPECLLTGRASKESDVYSFGVAALEIACGRKVIQGAEEARRVNLVEWVWGLYGTGLIQEAVDRRLEGGFDEEQAKCLMIVGLWCSHPDASCRPSIKQAIAALGFETPLPSLPPQLPVAMYVSPAVNMSLFSSYVSASSMKSEGNHPYTSTSSTSTTNSSLQSEKSTSNTCPLLGAKQ